MRYSCKLNLVGPFDAIKPLLDKVLGNLDFVPNKMTVGFNEFVLPRIDIGYDKEYLFENLSKKEMEGVTSFSIHDSDSQIENVTPFFRFGHTLLEEGKRVKCTLEWIANYRIANSLLLEDVKMQELLIDFDLIYCYYKNQSDSFQHLNPNAIEVSPWAKHVKVHDFVFIAAPLMYFGQECNDAIPFELISKLPNAEKILIHNKEILKVSLFDIHDSPDKYRSMQEKFWRTLDLEGLIERYREMTKIDFLAFLQKRAAMHKKRK